MSPYKKPTDYFDEQLAEDLSVRVKAVYPAFDGDSFTKEITDSIPSKALKQRVECMADQLKLHLPEDYAQSVEILMQILGPENQHETGMFTHFYWLMPVAKFVEKYGLDDFDRSMAVIGEITKRNTGEYAVRPFIKKYPDKTLLQMEQWARDENFHLRRLASEGLRPKLPWAEKLDLFIEDPAPVFRILEYLKEDPIRFVQKSVANNIADHLKVNKEAALEIIERWKASDDPHTRWILKHALRREN